MRESSFIKNNQTKWQNAEETLKKNPTPDEIRRLYAEITDDLSFARTFYPNRSVRVYLNSLAQKVFQRSFKMRAFKKGRFRHFWAEDLPLTIYESKNAFILSFSIFALSFLIGWFSSTMDADFPRAILGDSYVEMTLENIKSGDPMAVYKKQQAFGMSTYITLNNLTVAFRTFALGIFFAVGTFAILLYNGVMVGSFQHFFYEQGLFKESFLTIWTHGTLEISAIVIAGAAGLTMGGGLLFPNTLTRLQSFMLSSRRGMKIMLGITPIFILAGFIEGFVTRYTETPDILRLFFIICCFALIFGYFVWYPFFHKPKVGFAAKLNAQQLPPDEMEPLNTKLVRTGGAVFSEVLNVYRKYLSTILYNALFGATVFCAIVFLLAGKKPSEVFVFPDAGDILFGTSELLQVPVLGVVANVFMNLSRILGQFFHHETLGVWLILLNSILISFNIKICFDSLNSEINLNINDIKTKYKSLAWIFLTICFACILLYTLPNGWNVLLPFFFAPLGLMHAFSVQHGNHSIFVTLRYLTNNFWRFLGLYVLTIFVGIIILLVFYSPLMWFYYEIVAWNLSLPDEQVKEVSAVMLCFVNYFGLLLVFPLLSFGLAILWFSLCEILEAKSLRQAILNIGKSQKLRGLELE